MKGVILALALSPPAPPPPPPRLSQYERERNERIARNNAFLRSLGLNNEPTPEELAEAERRREDNRRMREVKSAADWARHKAWLKSRPPVRAAAEAAREAIADQAAPPAPIGAAPRAKVPKVASGAAASKRAAAAQAKAAKEAEGAAKLKDARDRFLATGHDPVAPSRGGYAGLAPTKAEMLGKVDARVAAKKTSAAKAAQWIDRMAVDASFWPKVNHRCLPQENIKKKGDKVAGGVKRGSQKGQAAAAKKARTA